MGIYRRGKESGRSRAVLMPALLAMGCLLLSCGSPRDPAANSAQSEAPREEDYQRDRIAGMKAQESDPALLPGDTLPAVALAPIAGGAAVSLHQLAGTGTVTALVFYVPNERSRAAVTLLSWFQSEGVPINTILVDVGSDSAVSIDFAHRYAAPLAVYRLHGAPSWASCGIADSSAQLPVIHFIRHNPAAYASASDEFEAEPLLALLERPEMLGPSLTALRPRLARTANQPGATLLALYFKLWDEGRGAQAQYLAEQIPLVRRADPLAMLVWANACQANQRADVKTYLDSLDEENLNGVARGMFHYASAKRAYIDRNYPAAAQSYAAAIAAGMGNEERRAHYQLAQSLRLASRKPEAVVEFRKAIAMGFDNVDCYHFLGEIIDNERDKAAAIEVYDKALRLSPWAGELYWHRGQALHALQRHEEAVACWLKGASLEDNYSRNFEEAGNCLLWHIKRKDDAFSVLQEGVGIPGGSSGNRRAANLWNNLGVAASQRDDRVLAIACHLEAIRIQEDQPYAYSNLGEAYEAIGRPGSALWAYETGIERTPESPRLAAMKAGRARVQSGSPPPTGSDAAATASSATTTPASTTPASAPREDAAATAEPPVREAP